MNKTFLGDGSYMGVFVEIDRKKGNLDIQKTMNILNDFDEFKKKNELLYCTLQQEKSYKGLVVDTKWTTTKKITNDSGIDQERIQQDFNNFVSDNPNDVCQLTKLTCQDRTYVVEYTIFRQYNFKIIN